MARRPVGQESHELANFSAYSSHIGDKEGAGEKTHAFIQKDDDAKLYDGNTSVPDTVDAVAINNVPPVLFIEMR